MLTKQNILILALPRFDGPYESTSFNLAKEFARKHRVVYIDHPFTLKDLIRHFRRPDIQVRLRKLFGLGSPLQLLEYTRNELFILTLPVILPINWLPAGWLYSLLSRINDRIVLSAIKKAIRLLGIKDCIFINSFDPTFGHYFLKKLPAKLTIYHCVDDITGERYIAKHGALLEKKLMQKVDMVVVTSEELRKLKQPFNKNCYFVPNAADFDHFYKANDPVLQIPDDLRNLKKPVIGYIGNIGLRMDYELLKKVAIKHSDKSLVMIGPKDPREYQGAELEKIPNVHFLGKRNLIELPRYLKGIDVAIIPFLCNALTKAIYPLKINEYLAAGKSVVMTAFTNLDEFKGVTYVAENHQDFIGKIDDALNDQNENYRRQCIAKARGNTWEARVRQIEELIVAFLTGDKKIEDRR